MGKKNQSSFSMKSNIIFGITLVLALLAPVGIQWYSSTSMIVVFSSIWVVTFYSPSLWFFEITSGFPIGPLLILIRCLYAYQVKQYYEYKARFVPTLILGLVVDCFMLELAIVFVFLSVPIPLGLPIPLMVVVGWLLMRKRPRSSNEQTWIDEE